MSTSSGLWTAGYGEIGATLKALEDAGVTLDHLARIRSDKKFAKSVGAFIANGGCDAASTPATEFSLHVNYGRKIEDAVKDGKYDWSNSDITSKNFPTTRKGTADVVLHLIHFDRDIESDDAIAEMDKMGLRPAETHELLALGAAQPDLQREFPIIALGSVWQGRVGYRCVPCLYRGGSERGLGLLWFGFGWHAYCRFAAVPK